MVRSKILLGLILLAMLPAAGFAVANLAQSHEPASLGLSQLTISASGNATAISGGDPDNSGNPEDTTITMPVILPATDSPMSPFAGPMSSASVSITATVRQMNSSAVIIYDVSGSALDIGGTSYDVVNGTGIFNQHSLVIILHATVQSGDWTGMLILHGHAEHALSDPGNVNVTFDMPQSKLASKFFLSLKGTLNLS